MMARLPASLRVAFGIYKPDRFDFFTRRWIFLEFARRLFLSEANKTANVLLSYPRSGNHLARFIIENGFGSPTLGDPDSESFYWPRGLKDMPLFLANREIKLFRRPPLAVKSHTVGKAKGFHKLIFLVREPVEAVLSHLRDVAENDFAEAARIQVDWWLELADYAAKKPPEQRLIMSLGFMVTCPERAQTELARFLEATEISRIDDSSVALRALRRPGNAEKKSYSEQFPHRAKKVRLILDDKNFDFRDWLQETQCHLEGECAKNKMTARTMADRP